MQINPFFKNPFWGTSKNCRLDPKVCTDLSWLLVFKNGLKKHSSLINDRVIAVWSQCKKCDKGKKGRREGKGRGPARVWGFDYSYLPYLPKLKKKISCMHNKNVTACMHSLIWMQHISKEVSGHDGCVEVWPKTPNNILKRDSWNT